MRKAVAAIESGSTKVPEQFATPLISSWNTYGVKLADYRNFVAHTGALSSSSVCWMSRFDGGRWGASVALLENPEDKKRVPVSPEVAVDALAYCHDVAAHLAGLCGRSPRCRRSLTTSPIRLATEAARKPPAVRSVDVGARRRVVFTCRLRRIGQALDVAATILNVTSGPAPRPLLRLDAGAPFKFAAIRGSDCLPLATQRRADVGRAGGDVDCDADLQG